MSGCAIHSFCTYAHWDDDMEFRNHGQSVGSPLAHVRGTAYVWVKSFGVTYTDTPLCMPVYTGACLQQLHGLAALACYGTLGGLLYNSTSRTYIIHQCHLGAIHAIHATQHTTIAGVCAVRMLADMHVRSHLYCGLQF